MDILLKDWAVLLYIITTSWSCSILSQLYFIPLSTYRSIATATLPGTVLWLVVLETKWWPSSLFQWVGPLLAVGDTHSLHPCSSFHAIVVGKQHLIEVHYLKECTPNDFLSCLPHSCFPFWGENSLAAHFWAISDQRAFSCPSCWDSLWIWKDCVASLDATTWDF